MNRTGYYLENTQIARVFMNLFVEIGVIRVEGFKVIALGVITHFISNSFIAI